MRLTKPSFEEWVEHAFSRKVDIQQAARYFDPDHDWWDPKPVEAVAYLTRLFEDAERTLYWFSDDQIAQGLTYLVGTSASGDNGWVSAIEVPVEARTRCLESVGKLFDRLFAPRCTPRLSHLSEVAAGTLNCVCYMWWDEFPCIALPSDPNLRRLTGTALTTMERILGLDSLACQESSLHGLGHWQPQHASEVARIIDAFVLSQTELDPRLLAYAKAARRGCVL
jgi:hypothetical protein